MNPETVQSRLLDDDDREILPRPLAGPLPEPQEQQRQPRNVTAGNRILRHLLAAAWQERCDQPARTTEFQRDEDRAKIGTDGGLTFGLMIVHHHLQSGYVSSSTLPERGPPSTPIGSGRINTRRSPSPWGSLRRARPISTASCAALFRTASPPSA